LRQDLGILGVNEKIYFIREKELLATMMMMLSFVTNHLLTNISEAQMVSSMSNLGLATIGILN